MKDLEEIKAGWEEALREGGLCSSWELAQACYGLESPEELFPSPRPDQLNKALGFFKSFPGDSKDHPDEISRVSSGCWGGRERMSVPLGQGVSESPHTPV